MRNKFQIGFTLIRTRLSRNLVNVHRGFTLIELLVYMGLLTIFLTVLTQVFISTLDARLESESTSSVVQDGRFITLKMMREVTSADSILSPAKGAQSTSLSLNSGGTTYTYNEVSGNFEVSSGGTSDALNSSRTKISNLVFNRIDDTITVSFIVTSEIQGREFEAEAFQTTIGLR